jgi:transcriptional regulator with XRE-family HTH domain
MMIIPRRKMALQQSNNRRLRRDGRRTSEGPNPTDILVGSRLRMRRNMLGLTQEKLADKIGLTFQQVQKYERGANRIGASRLHELAEVFDVPVSFFFDETDPVRAPAIPNGFVEDDVKADASDLLHAPETQALLTSFYAIPDQLVRGRLFQLAKALAEPATDTARRPAKVRAAPSNAASRRHP